MYAAGINVKNRFWNSKSSQSKNIDDKNLKKIYLTRNVLIRSMKNAWPPLP